MAQGHSGINPADPGPPSRGRLLWALSDNVDRMIVKNWEGTERQVSETSAPFMKEKKYMFRQLWCAGL